MTNQQMMIIDSVWNVICNFMQRGSWSMSTRVDIHTWSVHVGNTVATRVDMFAGVPVHTFASYISYSIGIHHSIHLMCGFTLESLTVVSQLMFAIQHILPEPGVFLPNIIDFLGILPEKQLI